LFSEALNLTTMSVLKFERFIWTGLFLVLVLNFIPFKTSAQLRFDDWAEQPMDLSVKSREIWRINLAEKSPEDAPSVIRTDTIVLVDTCWSPNNEVLSLDTSFQVHEIVRMPSRSNSNFYPDTVLLSINHYNEFGLVDSSRGYQSHIDYPVYRFNVFQYDSKGRITKNIILGQDSSFHNVRVFHYNDKRKSVSSSLQKSWPTGYWNYDRKGRLLLSAFVRSNGDTLRKRSYRYLNNRTVLLLIGGSEMHFSDQYVLKRFDRQGNEIESIAYYDVDSLGRIPNSKEDVIDQANYYSYNKRGLLMEERWITSEHKPPRAHWRYHYNEHDLLILVEDVRNETPVTHQKVIYSNNLVSEVLFYDDKGKEKVKHTFHYTFREN